MNNTALKKFLTQASVIFVVFLYLVSFGVVFYKFYDKFHNDFDLLVIPIAVWIVLSFVGAGLYVKAVFKAILRNSKALNRSV